MFSLIWLLALDTLADREIIDGTFMLIMMGLGAVYCVIMDMIVMITCINAATILDRISNLLRHENRSREDRS